MLAITTSLCLKDLSNNNVFSTKEDKEHSASCSALRSSDVQGCHFTTSVFPMIQNLCNCGELRFTLSYFCPSKTKLLLSCTAGTVADNWTIHLFQNSHIGATEQISHICFTYIGKKQNKHNSKRD